MALATTNAPVGSPVLGGTGTLNLGGNGTGYNVPGGSTSSFLPGYASPTALTASPTAVGANSSNTSAPTVPLSAPTGAASVYGPSTVTVPGVGGTNGNVNATNPYGGPAYTTATDPGLLGQLTSTYGEGLGDTLYNYLQSGAGYNPQVAQMLLAQFQPQIAQGEANLSAEFGASGASDSSAAALAASTFQAQIAGQEDTTLANYYEQGQQNFQNILTGVSGINSGVNVGSNQGSTLNTINGILGLTSQGAGAASEAGVGAGGTLGTILSILGGV